MRTDSFQMQTLDTSSLLGSGRELPLPAVLQLQLAGSEVVETLEVLSVFRVLPKKRVVALANWRGQLVVAKLFFARARWAQHLERETRGIAAIAAAGIATPALLGSGVSVDKGTGVLLLQYLDNSVSVGQRWANADTIEQGILLRRVVALIAQCHNRGLLQKDIHLDNFLLQADSLYLLDAAAVDVPQSGLDGEGVDGVRSLQNLALFFAQFPVSNDPSVQTLYDFYRGERPAAQISSDPCMFAVLLRHHRQLRLKEVLNKLYRDTSAHICERQWHRFVVYRRELDSALMRELIAAPNAAIAAGRILKNGNSSTVAVVQIGGQHYVLKRYNIKGIWHGLKRLLRPSRAWVSWRNAHMLEMFGIATPRPVLMMERRMGPMRREAWLLCDYVGGEDALHFLEKEPINSPAWRRALLQFSALFHIMRDYGIVHGDMKATNFISTETALMVLDLDAMHQEHDRRRFLAAFRKDLQRFAANWQDQPGIAQSVAAMIGKVEPSLLEGSQGS